MRKRAKRLINELGWFNSILYLFDRIVNKVSVGHVRLVKYYIFAQPVGEKPTLPAHRGKDIVVKQIKPGASEIVDFPRPRAIIDQRYQAGGQCLAAYKKQVFSGFLWLNFENYYEDEVRCCYSPQPEGQNAWDYDVYVEPKDRISLVFAKLWDQANQLMRERRVTYTMSRISAFNPVSLTSHRRLGASCFGQLVFIKLGPWQLMFSSFMPYIHFSPNEKVIPKVKLTYNGGPA